ncbi:MacS family sensor histidine kinase [Pseudonocardia sp. CA-107938]|uniref:MacS family sensor histidine kinase n=1 Tax=Pseudonocardia sp. CA-107938 TaxID=3240021 RepID=UPI003D9188C9
MPAPGSTTTMIGATETDLGRPLEPLWRGLLVYRVLTVVGAVGVVLARLDEYAQPVAAVVVCGAMVVWTGVTGLAYLGTGAPRRRGWVAPVDVAVTIAIMATTPFVQTAAQLQADEPIMGSFWTSCAVLACALVYGVRGGIGSALAISVTLLLTQASIANELGDVELLVVAGVTVGYAATVLRRSAQRVREAAAAEAAAAERERLARAVHDGVLQVLGYVKRRAAELDGQARELGVLAGEQEVALRTLLVTGPSSVDANGDRDLAAALRLLGTSRVSVSAPADPVLLPARTVDELVAVVGAALANVAVHVGPDAPAWVLLEDLGDGVEISVRDAGPGIPPGRLAAAEQEGRMGVVRSMRGRVLDLGGSIECETGPDQGTEWIIKVGGSGR